MKYPSAIEGTITELIRQTSAKALSNAGGWIFCLRYPYGTSDQNIKLLTDE
jgi:hypothetical protein